jgi:hypothetical protein
MEQHRLVSLDALASAQSQEADCLEDILCATRPPVHPA